MSGVKEEIKKENRKEIIRILSDWNIDFENSLSKELKHDKEGYTYYKSIFNWLKLTSDFYKLVLKSYGKKIEKQTEEVFQPRASIIVFGRKKDNNTICGYHWISYAGERPEFRDATFDYESNAYKIITKEIASPFIYDPNKNNGQIRTVENNKGDYKTYLLLRINDYCVITVDWPSIIRDEDDFFDLLKISFQKSICPKIAEILEGKENEILKTKSLVSLKEEKS